MVFESSPSPDYQKESQRNRSQQSNELVGQATS